MKKFLLALLAGCLALPAVAQSPGVNSPFAVEWAIPLDSIKRTYGQYTRGLSPNALSTDLFQICGNATRQVRITKVMFSGRATAVNGADVLIVKRSSMAAGGTVAGPGSGNLSTVGIPYDAGFGASLAPVTVYSGVPTSGTLVGVLAAAQYFFGNLTTGVGDPPLIFDFGNRPASAIVLRSASQCMTVTLSPAATIGGAAINISAEWTEE